MKLFLPSMWWLCTGLKVQLWCVGNDTLPNILPQNHQQSRWNVLHDCNVSIYPGSWLKYAIHKVPCFGQCNNVQFVLLVGFHIHPWFPVQICIHCAHFPWDLIYLKIILESWIYVSLWDLLYPWEWLGKNLWRPCTCISFWCWRCRCLHVFSLWLNLMWVRWILLDSLWVLFPQWLLFYDFLVFLVWCHVLLLNRSI